MRFVFALLILSSMAPAAEVILHRRIGDSLCLRMSDHPKSLPVSGPDSRAVLTLPKPSQGKTTAFVVHLNPTDKNCSELGAELSSDAVEALKDYTRYFNPGERMEAVLSLRGIAVQKGSRRLKEPVSATITVPNEFTLAVSDTDTELDDYLLAFHVVYAPPHFVEAPKDKPTEPSPLETAGNWCVTAGTYVPSSTDENGNKTEEKCPAAYDVLRATYTAATGALDLQLEDSAVDDPSLPLNIIFKPALKEENSKATEAFKTFKARRSPSTEQAPVESDRTKLFSDVEFKAKALAEARRTQTFIKTRTARRRPIVVKSTNHITSTQMPVSINVSSVSTIRTGKPFNNVYSVEFHVNQPVVLQPVKTSRLWNMHQGLSLHFNGTNGAQTDNPDAASAGWLFSFSRYFKARCAEPAPAPCDFTRPLARRFSLEIEPKIETTTSGRDKNMVVRAPYVRFHAPRRIPLLANATLGGNVGGGFEFGRALTSRVQTVLGPKEVILAQRTQASDLPIRRGEMGAHLNVVFKKPSGLIAQSFEKVSFDFDWQYFRLFAAEQRYVTQSVDGVFVAGDKLPDDLPPQFRDIRPAASFEYLRGDLAKGARRFLNTKLSFDTGVVSFFVSYQRGGLPPVYQFVHLLKTGIQFEIGK